MNASRRVMLLVDADNVSTDVIQQAFEHVMSAHGAVHVRRAYCTAESALKNLAVFKRLSMRPIVNVATGKNSTDIALAVDAIGLAESERPDVVVIVSSDSDFAPLVIRLREKGCRVEGIGQKGKTGEDSIGVYDAFVDIAHRSKAPVAAKTAVAMAPAPAAEPAAAKSRGRASAKRAAAKSPSTSPAPARSRSRGETAPPRAPATPTVPEEVRAILAVVQGLGEGDTQPLNTATEALRAAGLLARSASSTKLFRKHPEFFELTPERQPNKVQYRGPRLG